MTNGADLGLSEDEFRRMNGKDQMLVLFRNTTETKRSAAKMQVVFESMVKKVGKHEIYIGVIIAVGIVAMGLLLQHLTGLAV